MDNHRGNPSSFSEFPAFERQAELLREAERARIARIAGQSHRSRPAGRSGAAPLSRLRSAVTSALALVARRGASGVKTGSEP